VDPQPDPNTHYEASSRFVTTDHYVLSHLFDSILGLVFAIFGTIEEFAKLPDTFADTVFALTSLVVIILLFVGNVLLGIAVWRSGTLPR